MCRSHEHIFKYMKIKGTSTCKIDFSSNSAWSYAIVAGHINDLSFLIFIRQWSKNRDRSSFSECLGNNRFNRSWVESNLMHISAPHKINDSDYSMQFYLWWQAKSLVAHYFFSQITTIHIGTQKTQEQKHTLMLF